MCVCLGATSDALQCLTKLLPKLDISKMVCPQRVNKHFRAVSQYMFKFVCFFIYKKQKTDTAITDKILKRIDIFSADLCVNINQLSTRF